MKNITMRWRDGQCPSIDRSLNRLEQVLEIVVVDGYRGLRSAAEKFLASQREGNEAEASHQKAVMSEAVEVILTDELYKDTDFVRLTLMPGLPPIVEAPDGMARTVTQEMVKRCATAIGAEQEDGG